MIAIIQTATILFMSILLEAFPYLLMGTLLSSIIQEFVPSSFFARVIPKNKILGSVVGCIMGFFLPSCDCAVIPVTKGLLKKGVIQNVATSFMLASPIINPIALIATYNAFYQINPKMVYLRVALGAGIAIIAGIIVSLVTKNVSFESQNVVEAAELTDTCGCSGHDHSHNHSHTDECNCGHDHEDDSCGCGHDDEDCGCGHDHSDTKMSLGGRLLNVLRHTVIEFFDTGRFLILGAIVASLVQIFVPFSIMAELSNRPMISIVLMGLFSYLLSLCSSSDAFIGRSFIGVMSNASVLSFLVVGPMLSLNLTILLLGNFTKKYTFWTNIICFILIVAACTIIGPMVF